MKHLAINVVFAYMIEYHLTSYFDKNIHVSNQI